MQEQKKFSVAVFCSIKYISIETSLFSNVLKACVNEVEKYPRKRWRKFEK